MLGNLFKNFVKCGVCDAETCRSCWALEEIYFDWEGRSPSAEEGASVVVAVMDFGCGLEGGERKTDELPNIWSMIAGLVKALFDMLFVTAYPTEATCEGPVVGRLLEVEHVVALDAELVLVHVRHDLAVLQLEVAGDQC